MKPIPSYPSTMDMIPDSPSVAPGLSLGDAVKCRAGAFRQAQGLHCKSTSGRELCRTARRGAVARSKGEAATACRLAVALQLGLSGYSLLPAAPASPTQGVRIGTDKQLFIDDTLVAAQSNVTLTVNPPVKTHERNIVAEHPWEDVALGYQTILEVDGRYHIWYACDSFLAAPTKNADGEDEQRRMIAYAHSTDGIHWEKPMLGLVEFRGSRQNNLVIPDMFGTTFLDLRRTDGNLFKFAGCGRPNRGVEIFTSPDGLRWKPFHDGPVLSEGKFDTQNVVLWDDSRNTFVSYIRRWEGLDPNRSPLCCRKIGRAESVDLLKWSEPEIVYGHDHLDPGESDAYNPSAVKYAGAPNAYFMFPGYYYHLPGHRNLGPVDIHFAASRDGIKWNRYAREPYVRLGPDGAYDDGSQYMGVGMFIKGAEIWMYYVTLDYLHGARKRTTRHSGVISRLVQRLDGFVSADAAYTGGELTTVPLIFDGRKLSLNVDTGAMGSLRVELLDESGRVVPGFSLEECEEVNGNDVAQVVRWKSKKNVGALAGRTVKLRFVMRSAKLYAFQFKS